MVGVSLIWIADANPIWAQQTAENKSEIVVNATNIFGQVDTSQPPIVELTEADINALGVGSIGDVIAQLVNQTGSRRGRGGRPVFLINGVPIASWREFRSYPQEAIRKVEILPEEVALKFGYPPDRRVINFLLKPKFKAVTVDTDFGHAEGAGYFTQEYEATYLSIGEKGRFNIDVEHSGNNAITEWDRALPLLPSRQSDVPSDPDPRRYDTLVPKNESYEATLNYVMPLESLGGAVSWNFTAEKSNKHALEGLNHVRLIGRDGTTTRRNFGAEYPLVRVEKTTAYSTAVSFNAGLGHFRFTANMDASAQRETILADQAADTQTLIASAAAGTFPVGGAIPNMAPGRQDLTIGKTPYLSMKTTLSGPIAELAPGDLTLTLDAGYNWQRQTSRNGTSPGEDTRLTRGLLSGGASLSVPIIGSDIGPLGALGEVSISAQAGVDNYSDYGTLYRWNSGVTWKPSQTLTLQATRSARDAAPSLAQLNGPVTTAYGQSVFDFQRGESVVINTIYGGNPALAAEKQRDWAFSANWELPFLEGFEVRAEYATNRARNVSASFPALTPAAEQAFPDRITRDDRGVLIGWDARYVNFAKARARMLNLSLDWNGSWGKAKPQPKPPESPSSRPTQAGQGEMPPAAAEQMRAQFTALRAFICGETGAENFAALVRAAESGGTVPQLPDVSGEFLQRFLARMKGDAQTLDPAKYEEKRGQICAMAPPSNQGARPQQAQSAPRVSFGGDDGKGRLRLGIYYTRKLADYVQFAPGSDELDVLRGASLSRNGTARNTANAEFGAFRGGMGLRLNAIYTGPSRIIGGVSGDAAGASNLYFNAYTKIDMRLFMRLDDILGKKDGFLKGSTLNFSVNNLFDAKQLVRDGNGEIPNAYLPYRLDPIGRLWQIGFRKRF